MIAALAKIAKIDVTKPSAAALAIESQTALMGSQVASRTIEDHLKRIPEALENRQNKAGGLGPARTHARSRHNSRSASHNLLFAVVSRRFDPGLATPTNGQRDGAGPERTRPKKSAGAFNYSARIREKEHSGRDGDCKINVAVRQIGGPSGELFIRPNSGRLHDPAKGSDEPSPPPNGRAHAARRGFSAI